MFSVSCSIVILFSDTHDAHGVDYYAPNEIRNAYSESRHASVRQRPGSGRRISAAELENLMVRQRVPSVQGSPYQMQYDQESLNGGYSSKKYNSVSDMKRRKGQRNVVASSAGLNRSTFEQAVSFRKMWESEYLFALNYGETRLKMPKCQS